MKTIVFQSFRTINVPEWIGICMNTVRAWSYSKGFDYFFYDDTFFDLVPEWYRKKTGNQMQLVTDYARLIAAKKFLQKGFDRTIWVDADLVIFNPENFNIDIDQEFAFCKEVWIENRYNLPFLGLNIEHKVNNAVSVFLRENNLLDFYLYACEEIIRNRNNGFTKLDVSTDFLTRLYKSMRFRLLDDVGLLSPLVLRDLVNEKSHYVSRYIKIFGTAINSANLCASLANTRKNRILIDDEDLNYVVTKLLESKGDIVNKYLK